MPQTRQRCPVGQPFDLVSVRVKLRRSGASGRSAEALSDDLAYGEKRG
jgi:hypothetical protein